MSAIRDGAQYRRELIIGKGQCSIALDRLNGTDDMAKNNESKHTGEQPPCEQPTRRAPVKRLIALAVLLVFQLVLVGRTFVSDLRVTRGDLYRDSDCR